MIGGDPVGPSPWTWDSGGDSLGRHIRITIPFNQTTRAFQNGTVVHRDPGCSYTKIVIGVPSDPDAGRTASVPNGDTNISANQLRNATGFTTIDQIAALQITAEP